MQQPTTHLLGGERSKSSPLETLILQPQSGVGRIDRAIARFWIGDKDPARCHDRFGSLLVAAPKVLADLSRLFAVARCRTDAGGARFCCRLAGFDRLRGLSRGSGR